MTKTHILRNRPEIQLLLGHIIFFGTIWETDITEYRKNALKYKYQVQILLQQISLTYLTKEKNHTF